MGKENLQVVGNLLTGFGNFSEKFRSEDMETQISGICEFGPYRLDVDEKRLLREGRVLNLTPKVFDILLVLVENEGHVMSTGQILDRVWDKVSVEEFNVTRNISTLRSLLGDTGPKRRYIETVPKRGYRFIGDVRFLASEEKLGKIRSIAVLPFKPLRPRDSGESHGLGMADAIIIKLSGIKEAIVRPTQSIAKYGSPEQDPLEAGRELLVDLVLDGGIQTDGDQVRVTTQLLRVSNGSILWSDRFHVPFTNIFAVEDSIAEKVADALEVTITGRERDRMSKRYTENTFAYQLYQKGLIHWNSRTIEGLNKSIQFFNLAAEEDPNYALAYAGTASSHVLLGSFGSESLPPKEAMPRAKEAAGKAVDLDPMLAEAHTSLALVAALYDWDWPEAEKEFNLAINLKPNYATAHHWYANCLAAAGQFDAAVKEIELAQQIDQHSLIISCTVGWVYYFAGQYERTIELCKEAVKRNPNFINGHIYLGLAYVRQNEFAKALREFQKGQELSKDNPAILAEVGYAFALSGEKTKARNTISHLKKLAKQRYVSPHSIAKIHLGLGEVKRAFELLGKAFEDRSGWLIYLKTDPIYEPLRSDPKFKNLVRRVGYTK